MAQPPGIVTARIDANTGLLAGPNDSNAIFEVFTQQTAPTAQTAAAPNANGTSSSTSSSSDDATATEQLFQ